MVPKTSVFGITKSSLIATAVVVAVVALVLGLLIESYLPPANSDTTSTSLTSTQQQQQLISIQDATLYTGSPSKLSYNSTCGGDAVLSLQFYNPTSTTIHITNVTISSSGLKENATAFVALSNSCLSVALGVPTLSNDSTYDFIGYVSIPLVLGQEYDCTIQFDNGQSLTQPLLAQSE